MSNRNLSLLDRVIDNVDRALRTVAAPAPKPSRPSPAEDLADQPLEDSERRLSASLMRVNHTGEVCAQALYQGQALTARLPEVRDEMDKAADEEIDHLAWCEQRLRELDSHTSFLNPVWYGMSFSVGAIAGLISDRISLGFVAATEDRVCEHLQSHLERLPEADQRSRAIVTQMHEDEARHAHTALDAGGYRFPEPVKRAMTLASRLMTQTSARL